MEELLKYENHQLLYILNQVENILIQVIYLQLLQELLLFQVLLLQLYQYL